MSHPFRLRALRHAVALVPVLAILLVLSGCGAPKIAPPCPPVRIDDATASFVKFRDGAPQDLSNMEYRVSIAGYKGQCKFPKNGRSVTVSMDVDFTVEPGPAAKGGQIPIYYFVAIPQYFPRPEGKKVMEIRHDLHRGGEQHVRESGVNIVLPLKKDEPAAAFDVYVGLQLTNDELTYNRAHPN